MGRIMENAPAEPQATTVTDRLYSSEEQKDVKNVWSPKKVAQAQTQNPLQQKKPTDKELQPLCRATRKIWAQWKF